MLSLDGQSNYKMQKVKVPSLKVFKYINVSFYKGAFFLSSVKAKAGMALEGSMVFPVFLFFIMTILLSLEAVRFQSQVQEALHQTGNKNAFLEYQVKYLGGIKENVPKQVKTYLDSQLSPYLCIQGGEEGIYLQDLSVLKEGKIEYKISYELKPFINWIPIGKIIINDRFFSHGWIGYVNGSEQEKEGETEIYVYITQTGRKYHLLRECTYLCVEIEAVKYEQIEDLRNFSGGKYYACERCRPLKAGTVYITSEGRSYHGQADCSSLKRTIVPLKEVAEYDPCSKCGE